MRAFYSKKSPGLVQPFLLALSVCLLSTKADDQPTVSASAELPKDLQAAENLVLVSAKLKSVAEVQDLVLKQQQLILEHLDALRQKVELLEQGRTNLLSRAEFESYVAAFDDLRRQASPASNSLAIAKPAQIPLPGLLLRSNTAALTTNSLPSLKTDGYRVQYGDTLSRIVLRWNDTLLKRGLPPVSQEQIEFANPGMNPDKIRAGQLIFLPIPEPAPKP